MRQFPNLLTSFRLLVIPIIFYTFFADSVCMRWTALILFILAALTDFFDGYLARKMNVTSSFGRFFDYTSDKVLVICLLFLLGSFQRLSELALIPAILIIAREVFISGMREFLAEKQVIVKSSLLAKWKTTIQLMALPLLIVGDVLPLYLHPLLYFSEYLLWFAALLAWVTGMEYFIHSLKHFKSTRNTKSSQKKKKNA